MQRSEAQPELEIEGQRQEVARVGAVEQELHEEAEDEGAVPEEAQFEQRCATPSGQAALEGDEEGEGRQGGDEAEPAPPGPSLVAADDEREDEEEEAGGGQGDAAEIEGARARRAPFAQQEGGGDRGREPDRQIDQGRSGARRGRRDRRGGSGRRAPARGCRRGPGSSRRWRRRCSAHGAGRWYG